MIRAKSVLLAAEGLANDVIAARLDTPCQIVSKWRQRFFRERPPGLEEQVRGGRQARFPPSLVVAIKAPAGELPVQRGVPLSRWSTRELLRDAADGVLHLRNFENPDHEAPVDRSRSCDCRLRAAIRRVRARRRRQGSVQRENMGVDLLEHVDQKETASRISRIYPR